MGRVSVVGNIGVGSLIPTNSAAVLGVAGSIEIFGLLSSHANALDTRLRTYVAIGVPITSHTAANVAYVSPSNVTPTKCLSGIGFLPRLHIAVLS